MAELRHVQGLDQLAAALRELPQRVSRNVLRGSVSAAAAVVRVEAKVRAPVATGPVSEGHPPPGTLKRAIYQKQIRELSDAQRQVFFVGVRHGKKYRNQGKKGNLSQDAYYWRWVEFGTSKMAAKPFMRPAFDTAKFPAVDAMRDYMTERIAREVADLAAKR